MYKSISRIKTSAELYLTINKIKNKEYCRVQFIWHLGIFVHKYQYVLFHSYFSISLINWQRASQWHSQARGLCVRYKNTTMVVSYGISLPYDNTPLDSIIFFVDSLLIIHRPSWIMILWIKKDLWYFGMVPYVQFSSLWPQFSLYGNILYYHMLTSKEFTLIVFWDSLSPFWESSTVSWYGTLPYHIKQIPH